MVPPEKLHKIRGRVWAVDLTKPGLAAGPVHQFLPQFHSSLLFTGNIQVAVILYCSMYMKCWALPSFRDFGHVGVFFYIYQQQQQLEMPEDRS